MFFIRWQSRKLQRPISGRYERKVTDLLAHKPADGTVKQDVNWTAHLVQCNVDKGLRVQRHIASIASFTESRAALQTRRRCLWDKIHDRLDRLGNRITIDDRRKIEAAIAEKIPCLTREEHEANSEETRKVFLSSHREIKLQPHIASLRRAP